MIYYFKKKIIITFFVLFIIPFAKGQQDSVIIRSKTINKESNPIVMNYTVFSDSTKQVKGFYKGDSVLNIQSEFYIYKGELHGLYSKYYQSGILKEVRSYSLGVEIGKWIQWYPNGKIKSYFDFGNDIDEWDVKKVEEITINSPPFNCYDSVYYYYKPKNGHYFYYYENGAIKKVENYVNNKKDGICFHYNELGKLIKKEIYKDGKLEETIIIE